MIRDDPARANARSAARPTEPPASPGQLASSPGHRRYRPGHGHRDAPAHRDCQPRDRWVALCDDRPSPMSSPPARLSPNQQTIAREILRKLRKYIPEVAGYHGDKQEV